MNNLARALHGLGELEGARKLHQQELDICKRVLGPDHPDTLTSMNNVALMLYELGDLQSASELGEHVLDVRRRVSGPEHPSTSVSAWNLFLTLEELGETARARDIRDGHLAWLLSRDPESLGAVQRKIRDLLMKRRK